VESKTSIQLGKVVVTLLVVIIVTLFLQGCATPVTKPLPAFDCAQGLKPEVFEPCKNPEVLPKGATFEQGLKTSGDDAGALRKCGLKAKVLQDSLKACKKSAGMINEQLGVKK
jgi:hypothetical protein